MFLLIFLSVILSVFVFLNISIHLCNKTPFWSFIYHYVFEHDEYYLIKKIYDNRNRIVFDSIFEDTLYFHITLNNQKYKLIWWKNKNLVSIHNDQKCVSANFLWFYNKIVVYLQTIL